MTGVVKFHSAPGWLFQPIAGTFRFFEGHNVGDHLWDDDGVHGRAIQ